MASSALRRVLARVPKHLLVRLWGLWPPFLGAGVRLRDVSRDLRAFTVEMPLRPWNRNYVGTHFGGSLYSLADPWFVIILIEQLGPGYVVWDKAAAIRFVKPGRGTVRARFEIAPERIAEIRAEADRAGRTEPVFQVAIVDAQGDTVAEVEKRISVRTRERARASADAR